MARGISVISKHSMFAFGRSRFSTCEQTVCSGKIRKIYNQSYLPSSTNHLILLLLFLKLSTPTHQSKHFTIQFSLISLLPFLALTYALPNHGASVSILGVDKSCHAVNATTCHVKPKTDSNYTAEIISGSGFDVRCKAFGLDGGEVYWNYIPGFNCWISALYTDTGCEGECVMAWWEVLS